MRKERMQLRYQGVGSAADGLVGKEVMQQLNQLGKGVKWIGYNRRPGDGYQREGTELCGKEEP